MAPLARGGRDGERLSEVWRLLIGLNRTTPRPAGVVYQHFDGEGRLLYVGSTGEHQFRDRHIVHARESRWWDYVTRVERQDTADRQTAFRVEAEAIRAGRPVFNRALCEDEWSQDEADYIATHERSERECAPQDKGSRDAQIRRLLEAVGVTRRGSARQSQGRGAPVRRTRW